MGFGPGFSAFGLRVFGFGFLADEAQDRRVDALTLPQRALEKGVSRDAQPRIDQHEQRGLAAATGNGVRHLPAWFAS